MKPKLPTPYIIDTEKDLATLRNAMEGIQRIAVDTESNSLHAYREQVCLIQLTIEGAGDFIVDPLRLDITGSVSFLGEALADPNVETILHAAEYDVMCLRRDFGIEITNLFDTMVAASILGWNRIGLGSILEDRYGIEVDKSMQRADWGRRPLNDKQVMYAQIDTHYLFEIRDDLYADLETGGHVDEARELFAEVTHAEWDQTEPDENDFWQITGAYKLNNKTAAILKRLFWIREEIARQQDRPVFKIMGDKTLMRLAQKQPRNTYELERIRGVNSRLVDWHGQTIIQGIQQGQRDPAPKRPQRRPRPSDAILARYDALHTWRKERAKKRGVSSEVIMAKDTLWELARTAPTTLEELQQIRSVGPWRRETYGKELLELITHT